MGLYATHQFCLATASFSSFGQLPGLPVYLHQFADAALGVLADVNRIAHQIGIFGLVKRRVAARWALMPIPTPRCCGCCGNGSA